MRTSRARFDEHSAVFMCGGYLPPPLGFEALSAILDTLAASFESSSRRTLKNSPVSPATPFISRDAVLRCGFASLMRSLAPACHGVCVVVGCPQRWDVLRPTRLVARPQAGPRDKECPRMQPSGWGLSTYHASFCRQSAETTALSQAAVAEAA